ncbi:hypothetical protein CGRA01v4_06948 [Colletotrichum graminicola]|nr:hypothetical protein CGRA01v4_06948 [Colletotrichum graminicola]
MPTPGLDQTHPPTSNTDADERTPSPTRVHGSYAGRCPGRSANPRSSHPKRPALASVGLCLVYENPARRAMDAWACPRPMPRYKRNMDGRRGVGLELRAGPLPGIRTEHRLKRRHPETYVALYLFPSIQNAHRG